MQQIKKEILNLEIKNNHTYNFEIPVDGIYLIKIIASAKSWWQNTKSFKSFFQDDDLAVKIDNIEFSKLNGKRGLFDGEAAWNGNNLKGLSKTNIFLVKLNKGTHNLNFLVDQSPTLESITIYVINENETELNYAPVENNPAQDGNRRQWMIIIPVNVVIKKLNIKAIAKNYPNNTDDDDIKLILDGKIEPNTEDKSHKNWFWCGRTLQGQEKEFSRELNWETGLHYAELWVDRMPELKSINFGLETPSLRKEKAIVVWEQTALREDPNQNSQAIIEEINKGNQIDVLEKAVIGARPANKNGISLLSDRWHKAEFQGKIGYIYCEALEIEGESKEKIEELILNKAKELNEDGCLMVAVASRESKLFPYAVSKVGAQGLFQLMEIAISDVNKEFEKDFSDRLDVGQSIESGILYFQIIKNKYQNKENSLEKTLAAWNWGIGHINSDKPFILNNLPQETQQFVKEVIKASSVCKGNAGKSGKVSISWLIGISFCIIILFLAGWFLLFEKKFELPKKYKNYSIVKEESIDVDKDGRNEKLVVISNIQTEHSFGDTKTILIKKDGTFLEVSQYGSELQWQKIGDFNNNGKIDIATFYGYSGSAGFGKLYLQEWSENSFSLLLSKEDVENTVEFKDLDNDGIEEIVYNFYQYKWGKEDQEIYKWDSDKRAVVLK
jgi:hypothetical protein